nr:MarR family winged helix-turn-helix transcriptional regulator [Kineococcus siccus]
MTAHQFGVLVQLSVEPGVSQAALARRILITPQSMGELILQMVELGLVERHPAPRPGAASRVELTAAGREKLAATYPGVAAVNAPSALGLTAEESAVLNDLLHRVLAHEPPPG